MSVVARFRVNAVEDKSTEAFAYAQITLGALYSPEDVEDSEVLAEIRSFHAATPSGQLTMSVTNAAAIEQFQVGDEHYLRLEKIPVDQTVQAIYVTRAAKQRLEQEAKADDAEA